MKNNWIDYEEELEVLEESELIYNSKRKKKKLNHKEAKKIKEKKRNEIQYPKKHKHMAMKL